MDPGARASLLEGRFRANPAYELVVFDRLSEGQRAPLLKLTGDPDFYGVLRGRSGASLPVHALDCDTALLFLTLQQPGKLPGYAAHRLGANGATLLRQLVLDGVLEAQAGEEFVSGAAAVGALGMARTHASPMHDGPLARLARAALDHARALGLKDAIRVSAKLYGYNRYPLSPRLARTLPTPDALARHLGLEGGPLGKSLERWFVEVPLGDESLAWRAWAPRRAAPRHGAAPVTYKLYVSPGWSATADAFASTVDAIAGTGALQLKMGRDLAGVLRPDKLVVYFTSFDDLGEAAERVRSALTTCPAQGVPFTADAGCAGLLSWGLDPPRQEAAVPWQERESWRWWVTSRLAAALLAGSGIESVDPVAFAMDRLALEGFDTQTWTPSPRIWRTPNHSAHPG